MNFIWRHSTVADDWCQECDALDITSAITLLPDHSNATQNLLQVLQAGMIERSVQWL